MSTTDNVQDSTDSVDTTDATDVDATDSTTSTTVEVDTVESLKAKLEAADDKYTKLLAHSRDHEKKAKNLYEEKKQWETTKASLETKLTKFSTELEEKNSTLKQLTVDGLKTKVAAEHNIPLEAAKKWFKSETEEDLVAEAEDFKKFVAGDSSTKTSKPVVPINRTQATGAGAGTAKNDPREALKQWQAKNLNK